MIVVGLLMTSRLAYHASVRTVRERLGDDVEVRVLSWNPADLPLDDVADTHVVVSPTPAAHLAARPTGPLPVGELNGEAATSEVLGLHDEPATSGVTTDEASLKGEASQNTASRAPAVGQRLEHSLRRVKRHRATRLVRRVVRGGLARQFARACRSGHAPELLRNCDVVIAMDVAAIQTAYLVGRRDPHPAVVYGLDAGHRAVAAARSLQVRAGSPPDE